MRELNVQTKFRNLLAKSIPEPAYYKIPDFPGGTKRPFDAFLIRNGVMFCIEFKKSKKEKPTAFQQYYLDLFACEGAHSMVVHAGNVEEMIAWILLKSEGKSAF